MWFGWSGEVVASGAPQPQIRIEERGPVTFATVGLSRRDYDQYYRGFSNATLWPAFHYRADLIHYDRHDFDGYRRVNVWLAQQLSMSPAAVTAATAQLDNALEGALWVLPLMEWWYATSLRSILGDSLPQRKKRA